MARVAYLPEVGDQWRERKDPVVVYEIVEIDPGSRVSEYVMPFTNADRSHDMITLRRVSDGVVERYGLSRVLLELEPVDPPGKD